MVGLWHAISVECCLVLIPHSLILSERCCMTHATEVEGGVIIYSCVIYYHLNQSESGCKYLEIWDGVGDLSEVWGDDEPCVEIQPFPPVGGTGLGPDCADPVALQPPCLALVIFCLTSDGTRQSFQE